MRGRCYGCVPVSIAVALMLAAPLGTAFAQDAKKLAATFNERFPVEETSTPPPLETPEVNKGDRLPPLETPELNKRDRVRPLEIPEVKKKHSVRTTRAAKEKRPRIVVVPRSFLNAGTNVVPGDRKFLDYAFPPTHTALDVVSNTGARVGWHNSPLPGPFFPQ
jgi:hypothetical protein